MSIRVISWALNDAPVKSPTEAIVLVAMADTAHDDGTDSRQAVSTIAKKSRVSARTVQRVMRDLEERGLIKLGDQRTVQHFPVNHRPVVWDLAIENRGVKLTPLDENRGVKSEFRGDIDDGLGVSLLSPEPSLEPPLKNRPRVASAKALALTSLPADFSVSQEELLRLSERYPNLDVKWQLEQFKDKALAKGWTYKNWAAGFRTWLRTADTYASKPVSYGDVADAGRRARERAEGERIAREFYESEGITYK